MLVLFAESKFWDKRPEFKARYEAKVMRAAAAAGRLLPHVPKEVTFVVQAFGTNWDVIPEYGWGGYTKHSQLRPILRIYV
jgi:hypothetical protein